jgi:uncharacterized protein (TIGR00375 family)
MESANSLNIENAIFADLHIHSRFSRACSKDIDFENLVKWAKIKGLNLLGTGDFTHPAWFKEIREKLEEKNGFYYYQDFPFIITGEISLIYSQMDENGRNGRRIHLVLLVPDISTAERIHTYLDRKGRRDYDGRPIFKISGEEFVREMMNISPAIEIIPAHIWTPWFGVFGSMSGFDSLKECFGKETENIHAIETGMSSDPEMNWRIKEIENKAIVSFSDSHSFWPFRMGREATIFHKTDSYKGIIEQIRNRTFIGTVETEPAYGKYHYDGHRNCNFSSSPEETRKLNGICPVCHKPLVIGVDNRVEKLADNPKGHRAENGKPFFKILPLHEVIAVSIGAPVESKRTWGIYNSLIENFGNEFNILLNASKKELLGKNTDEKLAELIIKNREGKIKVIPGYDGEYGKAVVPKEQATLF